MKPSRLCHLALYSFLQAFFSLAFNLPLPLFPFLSLSVSHFSPHIYFFFSSLSFQANLLQCKTDHSSGLCTLSSPSLSALSLQHSFLFSFSFINDRLWPSLTPLTPARWSIFERHADRRMTPSVKHHLNVFGLERQCVAYCNLKKWMWKRKWENIDKTLEKGFEFRPGYGY